MRFDKYKEIGIVTYGDYNISFIDHSVAGPGAECFRLHWHDRVEILRIIKGSILITIEAAQFVAGEGTVLAFNPGQLHMGVAGEEGAEYEGVMFELDRFKAPVIEKHFDLISHGKAKFNNISSKKEALKIFDGLYNHSNLETTPSNVLKTVGMMYKLLGILCEKSEGQFEYLRRVNEGLVSVLDYIDEHLVEPLTTEKICIKFGYSKSYFCRLFKSCTGFSFMNYCRVSRLERAKIMLREKNITANEVATECGFRNYSYFSRMFKKYYSISPAEYIEKNS